MLPALRLATLLITGPKMLEPWDRLANGVVTDDSLEDEEFANDYVAKGESEGTPLGREYVNDFFLWMSRRVKIRFWDKFDGAKSNNVGGQANFYSEKVDGRYLIARREMEVEGQISVSTIYEGRGTADIRRFLLDQCAEPTQNDRPEYQLCIRLCLVRVLLHELMHLFEHLMRGECRRPGR
jgi:hypothetical protein